MVIVVTLVALLACIAYLAYVYTREPSASRITPKGGGGVTQTQSEQNEEAIEAWQLAMNARSADTPEDVPITTKKAPKKIPGAKPKKRNSKKPQARRTR